MKEFMVHWGFGSLLLAIAALHCEVSQAEMPRLSSDGSVHAEPSIAWHDSLESGWQESRRRNVPMVIFITSDQCHYCDVMKQNTWRDSSVLQRVANQFVAIRLSPTKNSATLSRIHVSMYPMTMVGIPEGKIVSHRLGYQTPAGLHGLLSELTGRGR